MKTKQEVEDTMDDLALLRMDVLDRLLKNKALMQENMKNGYYHIGKSRYVLGNKAVSSLQLPNNDRDIKALAYVQTFEESISDCYEQTKYNKISVCRGSPVINIPIDNDENNEEICKNNDNIRARKPVEHQEEKDDDLPKMKTVNIDPIRWFSAFPPQPLRLAQTCFQQSLVLAAECISLQRQIEAIDKELTLSKNFEGLSI